MVNGIGSHWTTNAGGIILLGLKIVCLKTMIKSMFFIVLKSNAATSNFGLKMRNYQTSILPTSRGALMSMRLSLLDHYKNKKRWPKVGTLFQKCKGAKKCLAVDIDA